MNFQHDIEQHILAARQAGRRMLNAKAIDAINMRELVRNAHAAATAFLAEMVGDVTGSRPESTDIDELAQLYDENLPGEAYRLFLPLRTTHQRSAPDERGYSPDLKLLDRFPPPAGINSTDQAVLNDVSEFLVSLDVFGRRYPLIWNDPSRPRRQSSKGQGPLPLAHL